MAQKRATKSPQKRYLPKKRPRQARAQATYDSVLDATARLLQKSGYGALTTNHVADAAGIAIGSLYEYFPSKEVIVAELVRRSMNEVVLEIAGAYHAALSEGFEHNLRHLVHALFRAIEKRQKLMRVLWMDVPFLMELEEVQRLPELMYQLAFSRVAGTTSPWVLRDPESTIYLLTVMVRAAVVESVVVARPSGLTLERVEEALYDLLSRVLL